MHTDPRGQRALRTEVIDVLIAELERPTGGVVVSGLPGSGKSTALRLAREELLRRGRSIFLLSLAQARDTDLGVLIVIAVAESMSQAPRRPSVTVPA